MAAAQCRGVRARTLVDRLHALQDVRQRKGNGLEALSHSTAHGKTSRVIAMVKDHIDWLTAQIDRIESEIHDRIDGNADLEHDSDLIRSIPGCGPKVAVQVLAYDVQTGPSDLRRNPFRKDL